MNDLDRIGSALRHRVNTDPEHVEKGLAGLVLMLIDLVRELMERQAVRRIEGGTLSPEEIERLGRTFMLLERRLEELRHEFGLDEEDLEGDLGLGFGFGPLESR
jgi:hypothetical protein